jgi:hypothetical protein
MRLPVDTEAVRTCSLTRFLGSPGQPACKFAAETRPPGSDFVPSVVTATGPARLPIGTRFREN